MLYCTQTYRGSKCRLCAAHSFKNMLLHKQMAKVWLPPRRLQYHLGDLEYPKYPYGTGKDKTQHLWET